MKSKILLSGALSIVLLICGLAVSANSSNFNVEQVKPAELESQANAIDEFFSAKMDASRTEVEYRDYQFAYEYVWLTVFNEVIEQLKLALNSTENEGFVLAYIQQTQESWKTISPLLQQAYCDFTPCEPGNGTAASLAFSHGMFLRDQSMLFAEYLKGFSLPTNEEMEELLENYMRKE